MLETQSYLLLGGSWRQPIHALGGSSAAPDELKPDGGTP